MSKEHEQLIITKYDLLYEQRMTRVESAIENIQRNMDEIRIDFRWLVGIMLGGFGGLFAMSAGMFALMAHGFKWF
ncbi:MAG TPA: hypothetical protein VJ279_08550 [Hanamia sp.]|nr:hypothetical protein [Hanamia sp.]